MTTYQYSLRACLPFPGALSFPREGPKSLHKMCQHVPLKLLSSCLYLHLIKEFSKYSAIFQNLDFQLSNTSCIFPRVKKPWCSSPALLTTLSSIKQCLCLWRWHAGSLTALPAAPVAFNAHRQKTSALITSITYRIQLMDKLHKLLQSIILISTNQLCICRNTPLDNRYRETLKRC